MNIIYTLMNFIYFLAPYGFACVSGFAGKGFFPEPLQSRAYVFIVSGLLAIILAIRFS